MDKKTSLYSSPQSTGDSNTKSSIGSEPPKSYWNVIYFKDNDSVKTIKLSEPVTKLIIGLVGLLCSWCLLSGVYIYNVSENLKSSEQNLIISQKLLFEMQTQYHNVYERVYQDLHLNSMSSSDVDAQRFVEAFENVTDKNIRLQQTKKDHNLQKSEGFDSKQSLQKTNQ